MTRKYTTLRTGAFASYGLIGIFLVATGCRVSPPPGAAAKREILKLDAQWSKTAGVKDVDGAVAFYSDDAVLLPPDAPLADDKGAIRASWAGFLGSVETVSWEVRNLDIADSNDLAYLTGAWIVRGRNPQGKLEISHGKLLEVWRKQKGGAWKCVADTYNSDAPAAATPAPKK